VKLVAVGVVAAVVGLSSAAVAPALPLKHSAVVVTTISPTLTITFAPKALPVGTVVFKVHNASSQEHEFSIDGVTSAWIKSHGSGSLTVRFKRPALYTGTLADCGYLSTCAGGNPDRGYNGYLRVT
jgi:hypothetical protein